MQRGGRVRAALRWKSTASEAEMRAGLSFSFRGLADLGCIDQTLKIRNANGFIRLMDRLLHGECRYD